MRLSALDGVDEEGTENGERELVLCVFRLKLDHVLPHQQNVPRNPEFVQHCASEIVLPSVPIQLILYALLTER